jgi:type VI secretion system secreted protein VgrG
MSLDIHTAVITALVISSILIVFTLWSGIRSIRKARTLKFFRMRRDRMVAGWRFIFFTFLLAGFAFFLYRYAEPVIYNFFPPTATLTNTPTITSTPTISQTPTITVSPSITITPSETDTPTVTTTPRVPLAVESEFESTITPNPEAIFSPLQFAQELDENFQPINPNTVFQNPVGHLYAQFSYDQMTVGAQWTALWYRGDELVNYETKPWDGQVGGWGYSDWNPEPHQWLPGEYEVQIFVGEEWKVSGRFLVEGQPPTAVPSPTNTFTASPSPTASPTPTITRTPTSTITPRPTITPLPSDTHIPTATRTPRSTFPGASPTYTHAPTWTPALPSPTLTHAPTYTPAPPSATFTRMPTNTPPP